MQFLRRLGAAIGRFLLTRLLLLFGLLAVGFLSTLLVAAGGPTLADGDIIVFTVFAGLAALVLGALLRREARRREPKGVLFGGAVIAVGSALLAVGLVTDQDPEHLTSTVNVGAAVFFAGIVIFGWSRRRSRRAIIQIVDAANTAPRAARRAAAADFGQKPAEEPPGMFGKLRAFVARLPLLQPSSIHEDEFAVLLATEALTDGMIRDHRFCEGRAWSLDFAWPEVSFAVEVHDTHHTVGHRSISRMSDDLAELETAQLLGWTVYTVPSTWLDTRPAEVVEAVRRFLRRSAVPTAAEPSSDVV